MAEKQSSARKLTDKYAGSPLSVLSKLLKDYFVAIATAATVALLLRVYVIEAFRIPTDFMAPMLLPGDLIFVDKLAYVKRPFAENPPRPDRGDVVIFSFPNDPARDYIKRVIAVEGDTIEIKASQVYLNGKSISRQVAPDRFEEVLGERTYQVQWMGTAEDARQMVSVKVPPGSVFVLGDNRAKGQDSRVWGFLQLSSLKGKASFIWFSTGPEEQGKDKSSSAIRVRWSRVMTRVK